MFIQSIFNSTLPNFIHSSISLIISALRPPKCLILSTEFPPGHGHRNKSPQSPEKIHERSFCPMSQISSIHFKSCL